MKRRAVAWLTVAVVGACLLALAAAGCKKAEAPPEFPQATPKTPAGEKAKLTAWINVTSGCQKETVQLLKELAETYKDRVEVEIIDFGQPEGARRWQDSGLGCMAIQFNGETAVTFPKDGEETTAIFKMPAGFTWTHEDLRAAFAALANGTLRPATEQEIAELTAPRMIDLDIRSQEVSDMVDGHKRYGQLLINNEVVARLYGKLKGKSPAQRAKAAQLALEKWISQPVLPSDLSTAQGPDGWGVYAQEILVLVALPEDAARAGKDMTPEKLADKWLKAIRKHVAQAAAEARKKAKQEEKKKQETQGPGAGPAGDEEGTKTSEAPPWVCDDEVG